MLTLDLIRDCLEGAIPSAVATCAPEGTPNVTLVSQVHYVDGEHVALSFQFFNKTSENIRANPHATALVIHPATAAQYRLSLEYLRTETSGPLFESMKAKLAGIASHTGMSGVFRLLGSDVYRVHDIEAVPSQTIAASTPRRNLLSALRACCARLTSSVDLAALLDTALSSLETHFGIRHSMILMLDSAGHRLYTVASRGYPQSGVGAEIALGCGVIGVAAEQRSPIRIGHMTAEYSYGRAIRQSVELAGLASRIEIAIPFAGLQDPGSQLAVPIIAGARLLGVLYVESPEELQFTYDDEDALVAFAAHLGAGIHGLQESDDPEEAAADRAQAAAVSGASIEVRHYAADDSVFIDDDYLIKGVAGAIFSRLLRSYSREKRCEFSNRELRLDHTLGLPDITDNLEARLVLLQRRLAERNAPLRIEKTGRGRFRLRVDRPFTLSAL
jgi:adenylate cyclase